MARPSDADKPVPRPPKTPAQLARITAQDRRREYLARHPSYYDSWDHELADPARYERLVRRFQTPAERAADARARGFARALEAGLVRGEQRGAGEAQERAGHGDADADADADAEPTSREHGRALWRAFLRERFVRGRDADFDYAPVDADDGLDAAAARAEQDRWFDDEEPGWDEAAPEAETGVQDF